jgi:hypothetical protein
MNFNGFRRLSRIFTEFRWFSVIFTDFGWFWVIFIDFGWFSLILGDFHWFWVIFIDFGWLSLILVDFHGFWWIFTDLGKIMETPWFSKSWRDAPETPLSKAVYSLNGSEMSFHGGGGVHDRVFWRGQDWAFPRPIYAQKWCFSLQNALFYAKCTSFGLWRECELAKKWFANSHVKSRRFSARAKQRFQRRSRMVCGPEWASTLCHFPAKCGKDRLLARSFASYSASSAPGTALPIHLQTQ